MKLSELDLLNGVNRVYYAKLTLGKYTRPSPFKQADWAKSNIYILPLPNVLRDYTSTNFRTDDLELVGDIVDQNWKGAIARSAMYIVPEIASQVIPSAASAIGLPLQNQNITPASKIATTLQQAMGVAPNPNPTVAFEGPELRTFTFTWSFNPRNETETATLKKFIKTLKGASLPTNSLEGQTSILRYPSLAQINFYPWDSTGNTQWGWGEDSIIKMKRCFMTDVDVNYAPTSLPAFFSNQEPAATDITITFKEIEYMLGSDWGADPGHDDLGDFTKNLVSQSVGPFKGGFEDLINSTKSTIDEVANSLNVNVSIEDPGEP